MLYEFIRKNRSEIINRTRRKAVLRQRPSPTEDELLHGVPLFLDQLADMLRFEGDNQFENVTEVMAITAAAHGGNSLDKGFSITQVVHDYGDIFQAVTELAIERFEQISNDNFRILNRCLDNAIASAATEYYRRNTEQETERKGFFIHELRNRLNSSFLSLQAIKSGKAPIAGSTMEVLNRSLLAIRTLIDRSLLEVRVDSGLQNKERFLINDIMQEVDIAGQLDAESMGLTLVMEPSSRFFISADRYMITSALSNLIQNAFKYTRPKGCVWVRTRVANERILVSVEDECGGLPSGKDIFRPFAQGGSDHTGLGLGLAISKRAVEANDGTISVVNMPGKGCVFTMNLPLDAVQNGTEKA